MTYCRVELESMGEDEWVDQRVVICDSGGTPITDFIIKVISEEDLRTARLVKTALQRVPVTTAMRILENREREPLPVTKGSIADQLRAARDTVSDMTDMLNGEGDHADHTQIQIGRCVHCSCGIRAQANLKQIRGK